jgi:hypothetical protein
MRRKALKFILFFVILSAIVFMSSTVLDVQFADSNYWDHHGLLFLLLLALFPRLTLLFSNVASGGLFWWLAWIFAPRLLVAVLATLAYWKQNPILVVGAWLVAIGGESSEKTVIVQHRGRPFKPRVPSGEGQIIDVTPTQSSRG